ncbi:MAG: bifunctional DNA-formamidopyrimidine glycosylase/DNA-(apurinic or apyrimidinic site) lyase [Patescibacteria group bacterium]|jgi:formamidopyrimidine-DNA glycosylase
MPELPEVETIVRDLNRGLKNKKIIGIESLDHKVFQLSGGKIKEAVGKKIKAVKRRAKMIIIDLGELSLIVHLKMTGQLVYKIKTKIIAGGHPILNQAQELPNKFTRVIFRFNDKSALYFNDVRRFGWIKLVSLGELKSIGRSLGVEPLSPKFTLKYFKQVLTHKRKTTIKQFLLDQKYIAGIGNIYADEALFAARLKPVRRVETLRPDEIKKLWLMIPKILRYAIKYRGTSFNDYVDARGQAGNFVKYLQVYGRAGEKCRNCGGIVRKMKLGGRGTHWCDRCQK